MRAVERACRFRCLFPLTRAHRPLSTSTIGLNSIMRVPCERWWWAGPRCCIGAWETLSPSRTRRSCRFGMASPEGQRSPGRSTAVHRTLKRFEETWCPASAAQACSGAGRGGHPQDGCPQAAGLEQRDIASGLREAPRRLGCSAPAPTQEDLWSATSDGCGHDTIRRARLSRHRAAIR